MLVKYTATAIAPPTKVTIPITRNNSMAQRDLGLCVEVVDTLLLSRSSEVVL